MGYQNSLAECNYGLGVVQLGLGRAAEALASHERALAIYERLAKDDPSTIDHRLHLAMTYNSLGVQHGRSNRPAESLASYNRALAIHERLVREVPSVSNLHEELARTYFNIGNLHARADQEANALDAYQRALPIRERLAKDHPESPAYASEAGEVLGKMSELDAGQRRFDEARIKAARAIEWQRKAQLLDQNNPSYNNKIIINLINLIRAYEGLGRIDEAADARRELDELEARDPAKAALDKRLADVLEGRVPDDDAERVRLANRAYEKGLYAATARLLAAAMTHDPKLGDNREAQHRYKAARAAALAGIGRGNDDPRPDDAARKKLRRQALDWLHAELSAWRRVAMSVEPGNKATVAKALRRWKTDNDLAGLRDAAHLAGLPEGEREAYRRLWAEVDRLLANAGGL